MRLAASLLLMLAAHAWCQCLYLPHGRSALGISYSMSSVCDVESKVGNASFGIKGVADIGFFYASLDYADRDPWEEYPENYQGISLGLHPIKQTDKFPIGLSGGFNYGVVGYSEDVFEEDYYAFSLSALISRSWPVAERFSLLTTGGISKSGKVDHGEVFLPFSVEGIVNPAGQFKLVLGLAMLPITPCDRTGYSLGVSLVALTAPRKSVPSRESPGKTSGVR